MFLSLFRSAFFLTLLLSSTVLGIAADRVARGDADGDGWADGATNRRVTLRVVAIESSCDGKFFVMVDGLRFPAPADKLTLLTLKANTKQKVDWTVARRAIGMWGKKAKKSALTWKTPVKVTRTGADTPSVTVSEMVEWSNRPQDQTLELKLSDGGVVRLSFRTVVETFADPSPNDRDGDQDRDGIFDWEEAVYARHGVGLGDPARQDLILVAGHTHADWKMTDLTWTMLRSKFHERDINMYIIRKPEEGLGLATPGLMHLKAKPFPREYALNLKPARKMRKKYLKGPMLKNAHLVVLSHRVGPKPESSWGWAEFPGNTLIIRSWLPMLGPDFHQYQAKDLMHELGHNLGLAHPPESDERCPSGPIPIEERTSSSSVMGTPRSDRGNPMAALKNALARPLDYSPTQWKNVRLDWVRKERKK
ncbi:MAG: hypothetical protein PVH19_01745 [Planctomycetia bacterium]|jgi:hypothetical protein